MPNTSDSPEVIIPPVLPNEIELVVRNFKDNVILPVSRLLDKGDLSNKIKDFHGTTIYSEWKEIPNFLFRIMFFPVCPHSEGPTLNHLKISAYVEASRKEDWPENWMCYGTRFCIIVIHHKEPHSSIFKRDTFNFSKTETDRGWQGILSLAQILEGGYLNDKGDLVIRAGVYPVGAEIDRSARDPNYSCRESTGFVGLQNHGATCYMNALLQSLYSITKFRKAVYKLSFDLSNVIGAKSYKIVQNLTKSDYNFSNYKDDLENDNLMDVDNPYPESTMNTYRHPGNSRYMVTDEYLDDNDLENDEKMDELLDRLEENDYCSLLLEEEEEKKKIPCVGLALQNLFYLLNYSQDSPACKELMKSFGWDSSDMFTQQDSHELLKLLLDKMEEQMKGTSVEGSVKNIFEGEMETYIECIDINYKSSRKETFEDIQLDVQGCNNIYESLDKLTEPELLAGENMYEAKGHGKQRANKGIRFLKFPPVVLFLLKRFTFDLSKMDTVKLNSRFEFYKEINLSRYIQPNNDDENNNSNTDSNNNNNKDNRNNRDGNNRLLQHTDKTSQTQQSYVDEKDYEYVLQAVSVHHGSINSGHYYAFAKNENDWFKFDDEIVTKVSEYAVINDNFGGEDQECYNYLTTNPNNQSMYGSHMNRYRRSKVYNAYILMYVLKNKKNEILGDVDMLRENYQMMRRCKIQKLLVNLRYKIRERLNRFIKVKVYTSSDFEGNTLLNQHFNTWPNRLVLTQDKNTNLNDLLKHIKVQLETYDNDNRGDRNNNNTRVKDNNNNRNEKMEKYDNCGKLEKYERVDNKGGKTDRTPKVDKSEENLDVYYYVLGLNKQFNKFLSLNDVKAKHKINLETINDLSQLIRKEYYQQYDPTVYLLYLNPLQNLGLFEHYQKKKEESKNIINKIKISPRTGIDVFSPTSSTTGSVFTPTSSVFTPGSIMGFSGGKNAPILVFIKYYDIFSKDSANNLKCLKMAHVSPDRNASQLVPVVLEPLIQFMSNDLVTKYRLRDLKNVLKTLTNLHHNSNVTPQTIASAASADVHTDSNNNNTRVKDNNTDNKYNDDDSDKDVLLLDEDEELLLDLDNKIDLLMKKESLHFYWYLEMDNNFTNLVQYKKLSDQLCNGDILVCNFRPTDEMRREIEQVEKKTNQKEDFEPTTPSIELEGSDNFVLCSSETYLDAFGLSPDDSQKLYQELKNKWLEQRDEKVNLHQLYSLSVYDYPSYIQWKLNNIKVVFKLYDPLESLATWKNCSNGLIYSNQNVLQNTNRETNRDNNTNNNNKQNNNNTRVKDNNTDNKYKDTTSREGYRDLVYSDGSNANESMEGSEKSGRESYRSKENMVNRNDSNLSKDNLGDKDKDEENNNGLIGKLELVVDLRMPCKHVMRYVCWALGVDPCHVLIFNNIPNNFESVGSQLYSLDDFCNKDHSLGYSQQSLLHLFNSQGAFITHPNYTNTYCNYTDNYSYSQNTYGNDNNMDNESIESEDMDEQNNTGRSYTKYNLRRLSTGKSRYNNNTNNNTDDYNENVIHLGVFFEPYYLWNFKMNDNVVNIVAQIFNERVQVVSSLMCRVPVVSTIRQLCNMVSQNYLEFLDNYSSHKRANQTFRNGNHLRHDLSMEEEEESPNLILVDVLGSMYTVVDLESRVTDLPQYNNNSVRNLFAAPLRFLPNWTPEQHELLSEKKLYALTVVHQTPDREMFGHPFQVLVPPTWNFLQIKTHIRNTLDIPKRDWDRWTFYQVTDSQVRTWKSNDDLLDWDRPGLRLLAEHPRPTDKHRPHGVMKIT